MEKIKTSYRGSQDNYRRVAAQIAEKFGDSEVANYNPYTNCMTFKQWLKAGFRVNKGEKALKSITLVEKLDDEGKVLAKYPRTVNLFYEKQVSPIADKRYEK